MDKITLTELAEALAKRKLLTKKNAEVFVHAVFDTIRENLFEDELVKVKGLGTFKLIRVESRESVHVNTGERIVIDSHSKITFTPDKTLADSVNRPFAAFETVVLNDGTSTEDMERMDEPEQLAEVVDTVTNEAEVETEAKDEPKAEPVVETTVEPEDEPMVEPEPEPVAESIVETTVEPEDEPVAEPEVQQEVEPVVEPETEPVAEVAPIVENMPVVEDAPMEEVVPTEEVIPTPTIEEQPEAKDEESVTSTPEKEAKQGNGAKVFIWCIVLLLLAGAAYWAYTNKDTITKMLPVAQDETVVAPAPIEEEQPVVAEDTTEVVTADTIATQPVEPQVALTEMTAAEAEKRAADYPQIENGEYWITGLKTVHVVQKGEDLSILAKKYYDNKRLISYIIRMNHYTNAQASNLFVGAEVKIPELVKK